MEGFSPTNIIVRMPNWIGDLVMATPVLTDLRHAFPNAHITAMCREPLGELLKEDRHINEIFCFHKPSRWLHRELKRDLIRKLQQGHYDLGIVLPLSVSSAWWFWQGEVQQRLGYACRGRSVLLTDAAPLPKKEQHLVITYKQLLSLLGIPLSETKPRLFITDSELTQAHLLLQKLGIPQGAPIVGINPGAAYGSAKCWLPDRFRAVTEELLNDPELYVLYFGDRNSAALVKDICKGMSLRVCDLAGTTSLRELMSIICILNVLLTNDSGPMHIAAALGTPLVALFGSTNAKTTGPYASGTVICKQAACSPCYQRTCPIDFRCMKQIQVEEVYQAVIAALKQTKRCNTCH